MKNPWTRTALALGLLGVVATATASDHASPDDGPTVKALMGQLEGSSALINAGLFRDDLETVAKGAQAIADHPRVSASERARIKKTLGEDFGQFVAADHKTHDAGAALAKAAKEGQMAPVLTALATLQASCVGCHATFRARLTGE